MNILRKFSPIFSLILDHKDNRYAALYPQESGLQLHGNVWTEHYRNGELIHACDQGGNTFTTEGMARILNIVFRAQATEAAIYCGIFKGNVTPAVGDTAAAKLGSSGTYQECQDADYDDPATNRPAYTMASTSTAVATNAASKATFVMNASITVYGAFLASSQAKTATTGTLFCAKAFTTSRAVIADDELAVTYQITLTTS
jgi:hypothetical protein